MFFKDIPYFTFSSRQWSRVGTIQNTHVFRRPWRDYLQNSAEKSTLETPSKSQQRLWTWRICGWEFSENNIF